ncbi:hypothetical protein EB093_09720, partial [bacterium]|nr:hypothetical protein [bacterium]
MNYMNQITSDHLASSSVIIYGFGISGRWACDNFHNVVGIVDTDSKKWGLKYGKFSVSSPDILRE